MQEVWIKFNGKARGPYPLESIKRMHDKGKISDNHELWADGMDAWTTLGDIKNQKIHINFKSTEETMPESHDLDAYDSESTRTEKHYETAGAWRRFFARIFDVWNSLLLICMPLLFVWAYYSPHTYFKAVPQNELVLGMILIFIAFIVDSIIYDCFGNTLGKALLGLKLRKPGNEKYSSGEYLRRNMAAWWAGFAIGIPILNLVTMFNQYRRLKKTGYTIYDVDKKGVVIIEGSSLFKTTFFIFWSSILVIVSSIAVNF